MSRTQIILEPEIQRRAKQRASAMGLSLAEYVRRLLIRDLGQARSTTNPACMFDLGASGDSDISRNKDRMLGESYTSLRRKRSR